MHARLVLRPLLVLALAALALLLDTAPAAGDAAIGRGVWPLDPRPEVVASFVPPASRFGPGHRGVDLAGRPGASVRAARAGRVSFAGRLAGRGVVVVVHGATRTTYEPVAAVVRVGDRVAAGAPLGRLELFGSHCFPRACLHWGLIEGRDRYLDPLTLVGATPVRLLPLGLGSSGARPSALPPVAAPFLAAPSLAGPVAWPLAPPVTGSTAGPVQAPLPEVAGQARGWAWR